MVGVRSLALRPSPPSLLLLLQREGAGSGKGRTSVNISSRPPVVRQLRSVRCAERLRSAALHYRTSAPVQSELGVGVGRVR